MPRTSKAAQRKTRTDSPNEAMDIPAAAEPPPASEEPAAKPVADLFAAAATPPARPAQTPAAAEPHAATNVRELKQPAKGVGAKAAKPGYGLIMRTSEGEDSMTPFRSLDDLLSAVKPILRAAVRSPEAVWFSIQQVDLSTIELDVA